MRIKCKCGGVLRFCRGEDIDGNKDNYYECEKCGAIKINRKSNTPMKCPVCKRTYAVYLYSKVVTEYYDWKTYGLPEIICPTCEDEQ